jgi:hypothetical protein
LSANLSVEQSVLLAAGILAAIAVLAVAAGILLIRRAPSQPFFLVRQQTAAAGWRMILVAIGILALAAMVYAFGPTAILQVVSPTPTTTLTPTITYTPSITFTPSRTLSPTRTATGTLTFTASPSPTPFVPNNIRQIFTSNITPDPKVHIGEISFGKAPPPDFHRLVPAVFTSQETRKVVATFTYENMNYGVQFTAIWIRDGIPVYWNDSYPWSGPATGTAVIEWDMVPDYFLHGSYEVQIFIGDEWKTTGRFEVVGPLPTATNTLSPTVTRMPFPTTTDTAKPKPTNTPQPAK